MVQLLLQRAGHFCFQHLQTQESSPLHHAIIGGNVLCLKILIKFLQKFSSFIIGPDTKTVKILQSAFLLKNKSENSIFYQSGITENVAIIIIIITMVIVMMITMTTTITIVIKIGK